MFTSGAVEGDAGLVRLGCRVGHIQNLPSSVGLALEVEHQFVLHVLRDHAHGQLVHQDPVAVIHQGQGGGGGLGSGLALSRGSVGECCSSCNVQFRYT